MMLMEAARLRALILEAREDGLIKRFVPIIVKNMAPLSVQIPGARAAISHYMENGPSEKECEKLYGDLSPINDPVSAGKAARTAIAIIQYVLHHDPDPKKSFSTWMMTRFCAKQFNLEDAPRVTDALNQYAEAKKQNLIPRSHDLGTVKSLDDLYDMVNQFRAESGNEIVNRAYEATMYQQADVLIDSADYKMISPKTQEAAQWFGRHTEWCTAWGGQHSRHPTRNCLYSQYANQGRLYIIQRKSDGTLWQFHRESNSYMDANDRSINIGEFSQENPEIAHWFAEADAKDMGQNVGEITLTEHAVMKLYDNGDGRIFSRSGIGLGSRSADFSIDYDEDNCIQAFHVGYNEQPNLRENGDLVAFLNSRFNIDNTPMSQLPDLIALDITYKKGVGFGRPRDLGEKMWSAPASDGQGDMTWIKISETEFRLYCDMPPEELEDNSLWAKTRIRTRKNANGEIVPETLVINWEAAIRDGTADIDMAGPFIAVVPMLNLPADIYYDADTSRFHPLRDHDDNTPGYRDLVTRYPNVETIKKSLAVNGMTKLLRDRIQGVMANTISGAAKPADMIDREDSFSIYLFDDVAAAVGEIGDDTAKYVMNVLEGGGEYQDYESASDSQREELWDTLKPAQQNAIVEWIFNEHPEVDRDDYSDHDFSNSSDFIELYDEAGQPDELDAAFDRGVETGYRHGAEEDMSKAMDAGVKSSGLLFWDDEEKAYTKNEYQHDTKCAYFVTYASIIDWFDENDTDDEINSNLNHLPNELEWKVEVSQPYYGFSGYSESSAAEDFLEALWESGIIDRRHG